MKLRINEFITITLYDNQMEFLKGVSGTDSIMIDNFSIQRLETVLRKHKSQLSMVETSVYGDNLIENNIDKILDKVNEANGKDMIIRYLTIRYDLPKNVTPLEHNGKIVGWQTYTNPNII